MVIIMPIYEHNDLPEYTVEHELLHRQRVLYVRVENIERMIVLIGKKLEHLEKYIKGDIP